MTPFAVAYSLHLLAALIWVGGMFFAWMILRPAAMAALDGPARLKLWVEVFQRFFWLGVGRGGYFADQRCRFAANTLHWL